MEKPARIVPLVLILRLKENFQTCHRIMELNRRWPTQNKRFFVAVRSKRKKRKKNKVLTLLNSHLRYRFEVRIRRRKKPRFPAEPFVFRSLRWRATTNLLNVRRAERLRRHCSRHQEGIHLAATYPSARHKKRGGAYIRKRGGHKRANWCRRRSLKCR